MCDRVHSKVRHSGSHRTGWTLAVPGCVALPPPEAFPPLPPSSLPVKKAARITTAPPSKAPHVVPPRVKPKNITVLTLGLHVSHINSGKTHLWMQGDRTLCRSWKCGPPDDATPLANLMDKGLFIPDLAVTPQCRLCFSKKLDFLHVPHGPDMGCHETDGALEDGVVSSGHSSGDSSDTVQSYSSISGFGPVVKGGLAQVSRSSSSDNEPILSSARRA